VADNIIVCDDGSVHLNDWGSARPPGLMSNTGGTNPVYGCPVMGAAFESGMGSFLYTPLSDLRALFISLFAFSLLPRQRAGEEQLAAVLPWERVAPGGVQAAKFLHLYGPVRWDLVQLQAVPLLQPLHFHLFRVRQVEVAHVCQLLAGQSAAVLFTCVRLPIVLNLRMFMCFWPFKIVLCVRSAACPSYRRGGFRRGFASGPRSDAPGSRCGASCTCSGS
jgi:hypothetical protein